MCAFVWYHWNRENLSPSILNVFQSSHFWGKTHAHAPVTVRRCLKVHVKHLLRTFSISPIVIRISQPSQRGKGQRDVSETYDVVECVLSRPFLGKLWRFLLQSQFINITFRIERSSYNDLLFRLQSCFYVRKCITNAAISAKSSTPNRSLSTPTSSCAIPPS